ncbi:MAG: aminotransferase class I/II-fold pyridoxal phosphate-dependent enzyme [Polaromonas sp.]|nr:aminotransferase class I/II-fold pyridoxal phosphate-dependent enzyme [Polaromonas sp.]
MTPKMYDLTDALHLQGDVFQHATVAGQHLLDRLQSLTDWANNRLSHEVDANCKATHGRIQPRASAHDRAGRQISGVNFASQDYLSLSSHPQIVAAAQHAAATRGVHSAGSSALMGLTDLTLELEREMAAWLGYNDATVFPTGWGAGYGVIKALVRPTDHVVIDMLAHACLMEGARAATPNVHAFAHLSARGLESRLARVRRDHPDDGIMVVTESLFSMDSDTPDLRHAVRVCQEHGATLVVDCAHDLGCMGADGLGHLAAQGVLGEVDIVMGSFSKTFASNGGFVASSHPALKLALRFLCGPQTYTNAMSPIQAAVVLKALEIVRSDEGRDRRVRLMDNINYLRSQLADCGFVTLGAPSPIVPTMLGDSALSRLVCGETLRAGALVNLVEYPAVSRNTSRLRLQVMADHSEADIDEFCTILTAAGATAIDSLRAAQEANAEAMT